VRAAQFGCAHSRSLSGSGSACFVFRPGREAEGAAPNMQFYVHTQAGSSFALSVKLEKRPTEPRLLLFRIKAPSLGQ
jgi:hypothetical protein